MNFGEQHCRREVRRNFWDSLCPKKNVRIVAARIDNQSQRVDVASFVQLKKKSPHGDSIVVRLLNRDRTSSPRDGMKWLCVVYERFVVGSKSVRNYNEVVTGLGANVPELYQTDKVISIFAHEMLSIAFVFHHHELTARATCLHGMDNGYFIRYRIRSSQNGNDATLEEIPMNEWFAFPCESPFYCLPQSYAKTVFVSLDYIKHYLGLAANRCGDIQGPYPRARYSDFLFPAEAWAYIKCRAFQLTSGGRFESCDDVVFEKKSKKRKVSRLVANVSISSGSFGVKEEVELLKFGTEDGVAILEKVLGIGSVWGFRHRRPKYGERRFAERNDTMNAIFGDSSFVQLTYNTNANRLSILAQYEAFVFDFNNDGELVDCPSPHFLKYCSNYKPDETASMKNAVVVNALFRLDGRTYKIERIINEEESLPDIESSTIYARVITGPGKGELHEFENEGQDIAESVIKYYKW